MAYSHVAHDCRIGDGVELANGVQLAGQVEVGDQVGFGGLAAVHQFVRVGRLAFVGAGSMVSQDVPPFALVSGDRARVYDINVVGLKRHGIDEATRRRLRRTFKLLLAAPTLREGIALVREGVGACDTVEQLLRFAEGSERGLCRKR
jgi:UDP-N-acetylglucosamine acyltransferase